MNEEEVRKVVWTRRAREALVKILVYRYSDIPSAYDIVENDILAAAERIVFPEQYQVDEYFPEYRRIIVRDYKLLYKHENRVVYILDVICTRAKN